MQMQFRYKRFQEAQIIEKQAGKLFIIEHPLYISISSIHQCFTNILLAIMMSIEIHSNNEALNKLLCIQFLHGNDPWGQ